MYSCNYDYKNILNDLAAPESHSLAAQGIMQLMKKTSESRIKGLFSSIFRVRVWSDWDRTQSFFVYISKMFQHLFILQKPQASSLTFEEVVTRKKLTDLQLNLQARDLHRLSLYMLLASFVVLIYVIYQCFYGTVVGILLSLIVWMIALVLAFRYSYWLFIIQTRNFSCSLSSWFKYLILRKKT